MNSVSDVANTQKPEINKSPSLSSTSNNETNGVETSKNKETTNKKSVDVRNKGTKYYRTIQNYQTGVKEAKNQLQSIKAELEPFVKRAEGLKRHFQKQFDDFTHKKGIFGQLNAPVEKLEEVENPYYTHIHQEYLKRIANIKSILSPKDKPDGYFNNSWNHSIDIKNKRHFSEIEMYPLFDNHKITRNTTIYLQVTDSSSRPYIYSENKIEPETLLTGGTLTINGVTHTMDDDTEADDFVQNIVNAYYKKTAEEKKLDRPEIIIEYDKELEKYKIIRNEYGQDSSLEISQQLEDDTENAVGLISNKSTYSNKATGQAGNLKITLNDSVRKWESDFYSDKQNTYKNNFGNSITINSEDISSEYLNETEIGTIIVPKTKFTQEVLEYEIPFINITIHDLGFSEDSKKSLGNISFSSPEYIDLGCSVIQKSFEDIDKYISEIDKIDMRNREKFMNQDMETPELPNVPESKELSGDLHTPSTESSELMA